MVKIEKLHSIEQNRAAEVVDAVISLGSFCQVGGILWIYELKVANSPFDTFGLKAWHSIIPILKNRFADYWQLENMAIGKIIQEESNRFYDPNSKYYQKKVDILKVYCNRYNLVSNHHFILEENSPTQLKTYRDFRQNLKVLERIFLKQCQIYENIRFVCKAMDWPAPEKTEVRTKHVWQLLEVLRELRQGKDFTLALAVPEKHYRSIETWAIENKVPNLHLARWKIPWNTQPGREWEDLLQGVKVAENHYLRLVGEVIGDPSIDLCRLNSF